MKLNATASCFAGLRTAALALAAALSVTSAHGELLSPETNPPTDYREGYTANVVPKSGPALLYSDAKLSKVVGVKGDFFFLHTNYKLPYLAQCEWSNVDGVEKNDGLFHYHYEKTDTEEYALCQFQGRFRNNYLFVVTLKLTQVGDAIHAQVVGATYPYYSPYGSNQESTTFGVTYFEDLNLIAGSSGGMTRASLSNVSLIFAAGGATCNVTFEDADGNVLSEQSVGYGDAATPPDDLVPQIAGYLHAGWDGDYSVIQKDIVFKPVYHKLCTVRFLYPDGTQIGESQIVEETKSVTPPDMTGATFEGKPFYGWIGDFSAVADDTDFYGDFRFVPQWTTGSYARTDWAPAADNLLADAEMSGVSINYYTEAGRTSSGNAADLCNGAVPQANTSYTGVVGVKGGSVEWTFADKVYISALNVFTSWGDGGRDGIAIAQVLYKDDADGEWLEVAGPVDNNAVSYGVNDNNSANALFATLANSNDSFFINGATELKVVFAPEAQQDNKGAGYVEIEAVGKTESQLSGGAVVTFLDWDGNVLKSGKVGFREAAVPPEDPVRDGYKFIGWDRDFSDITVAITVNALYHKLCSVTFKDADGTVLDEQTVEETFAAAAPDMAGRTCGGEPFLCWDGDVSVISDDVVFTAIYGVLPDYIDDVIATGLVPDGALIWAGGAAGVWDLTSRKWATASGMLTTWTDGSVAVLPVDASIELDGARSAAGIQIHDGDVVLSGGAVNLTAPAKIVHVAGGVLRFENDVTGNAGITVENSASAAKFMPLGEENAVKIFGNLNLSEIDTSSLMAAIHYRYNGAVEKIVAARLIADSDIASGINYFKSGDGWMSFECRVILTEWYNNPYIAKVVLKQVGADIYGYIEKAEGQESLAKNSSIEVTGGTHRPILVETSALVDIAGAATHRMAVEYIILTDRDPMWNAATEIAGDYQATGPISIKSGVLKVVNEGTVFGGHCDGGVGQTSPILISDPAVFMFDSSAEQFFATTINGTSTGNGYLDTHKDASLNGRFAIGPNARTVTFNCSSEGMHRFYGPVDVYGTVTIAKGTYHIFCNNVYGIFVRDGGVLNMNSFLGGYGLRDAKVTCDKGGVINCPDVWSLGSGGSNQPLTLDGGVVNMTCDYDAKLGDDIKQTALVMKNGALIDGVMMTWGRGENTLTVSGEEPSSVTLEKIRFGQNKNADSNKLIEKLIVNDVTGDDAADLTVTSELYLNSGLTWSLGKASNLGFVKEGAGTLLLTGVSKNFGGSVTMNGGTLEFGPEAELNGAALIVTGDSTLSVEPGAEVAFADSSAQTWTAGRTIAVEGSLSGHALRFGTDENGLTDGQLAAISVGGKKGRVFLNAKGYLRTKNFTAMFLK